MKKKYLLFGIVLSILGYCTVMAQSPETRGLEIAKEVNKRDNGWKSSSNNLTMILTNRHGQQTSRLMHSYFMEVDGDGDKSLFVFDSPKDVKGTATMSYTHKAGDDDQWLYLPAIKRVKRISSSNKSGPFMGSEFAFEDLSSQEVEKYTYKYIKDEVVDGVDCFIIERYPVDKKSGYTRQIVYVNKKEYRVEKTDYYDRKNALLKTLKFTKFKKYQDKYWRALDMHMVNHQSKKETRLEFKDIKFGIGLTDADFTQNSLKRAK